MGVFLCVVVCVCLCVCVNVCLCLFVVSTRQTFENIYFSPCDNATFLAQLALPAETQFSIQLSMLCSLSPLSLFLLFSAISILRLFFVPSAVWFLLLVNGGSSCWVCLDWVGTNKESESGALDLSTDSDKNAQRAASQTVKHP